MQTAIIEKETGRRLHTYPGEPNQAAWGGRWASAAFSDHVEIPDPPAGNEDEHDFDPATLTWKPKLDVMRARRKAELHSEALEELLTSSPPGVRLVAAEAALDDATTQAAIEGVKL